MAEKLIGSLIYGQHIPPKKMRPWKDRLKVPLAIATVLILIGGIAYKFANYREERQVRRFLDAIASKQYEAAYAIWEGDEHYTMKDFLMDWGENGYYVKGSEPPAVVDSNGSGVAVIVYVQADGSVPVAVRVDKTTLKLSFSPENKYK